MAVSVFAHVITMFIAVALSYGTIALLWVAARSRDVDALRGVARSIARLQAIVPVVFALGIALGLVAVWASGFNPLQRWLVAAYVLTAVAIVSANLVVKPWLARVAAELATSPGAAAVPAAFSDRRAAALLFADALVIVAIVADMVIKPFGA